MPSESEKGVIDAISYGRQHITQEDIDAVNKVMGSEYLNQGPKTGKFGKYYSGCSSLPIFPTLNDEEQHFVIVCIDVFYG